MGNSQSENPSDLLKSRIKPEVKPDVIGAMFKDEKDLEQKLMYFEFVDDLENEIRKAIFNRDEIMRLNKILKKMAFAKKDSTAKYLQLLITTAIKNADYPGLEKELNESNLQVERDVSSERMLDAVCSGSKYDFPSIA